MQTAPIGLTQDLISQHLLNYKMKAALTGFTKDLIRRHPNITERKISVMQTAFLSDPLFLGEYYTKNIVSMEVKGAIKDRFLDDCVAICEEHKSADYNSFTTSNTMEFEELNAMWLCHS